MRFIRIKDKIQPMKYAVIQMQGHQYLVKEKQTIQVDKLADPKKPEFDVLLVVDEKKISVGKPFVKGAKITLKVIDEVVKGKKVEVFKYKSKSRYRKRKGFRPKYSNIFINTISA